MGSFSNETLTSLHTDDGLLPTPTPSFREKVLNSSGSIVGFPATPEPSFGSEALMYAIRKEGSISITCVEPPPTGALSSSGDGDSGSQPEFNPWDPNSVLEDDDSLPLVPQVGTTVGKYTWPTTRSVEEAFRANGKAENSPSPRRVDLLQTPAQDLNSAALAAGIPPKQLHSFSNETLHSLHTDDGLLPTPTPSFREKVLNSSGSIVGFPATPEPSFGSEALIYAIRKEGLADESSSILTPPSEQEVLRSSVSDACACLPSSIPSFQKNTEKFCSSGGQLGQTEGYQRACLAGNAGMLGFQVAASAVGVQAVLPPPGYLGAFPSTISMPFPLPVAGSLPSTGGLVHDGTSAAGIESNAALASAPEDIAARCAAIAEEHQTQAEWYRRCSVQLIQNSTSGSSAREGAGRMKRGGIASHVGTKPETPASERTTVQFKNIPNDYTRQMFLDMLDAEGFKHAYDFVYLPVDLNRNRPTNKGYAFINFIKSSEAERFAKHFEGWAKWKFSSSKIGVVVWGAVQGLQANIAEHRNSAIMHPSVPDDLKPILIQDGEHVPFPGPTRRVRPRHVKAR